MFRILFISLLLTCCNLSAQTEEFSLTGKTSGIEDGTYLYFRDLANGGNIDSAMVKQNSFRFTTDLPEPVLFVMLFTKDRSKFTELWLEDKPMTFDAGNTKFKDAVITGSRNQELAVIKDNEVYFNVQNTPPEVLKQRETNFIENHPDALVSAYILTVGMDRRTQAEVADLYSKLTPEVQNSSIGQKVLKFLEKDIAEVGDHFLDFSLQNSEGKNVKISALRGKLTLLQFWSSSCGFSREMNRNSLSSIYPEYHPDGLEIISISMDPNENDWLKAIEEDQMTWPQINSPQGWNAPVFRGYGIQSTPGTILINEEGLIVAKNLRGKELEKTIEEYLTN